MKITNLLSTADLSRIIEMAWENKTPFDAIQQQYNLNESAVITLMRNNLKSTNFKLWRKRMSGRKTKHMPLHSFDVSLAYRDIAKS